MLIGGLATAGYLFTASNTIPGGKLGSGASSISGYAVSNVDYTLDTNPNNLASVQFDLNSAPPAAAAVKVKLVAAGSTWFDCTMSGTPAAHATCTTTGTTVASADELAVVVGD